jgi:hypothetical protein
VGIFSRFLEFAGSVTAIPWQELAAVVPGMIPARK